MQTNQRTAWGRMWLGVVLLAGLCSVEVSAAQGPAAAGGSDKNSAAGTHQTTVQSPYLSMKYYSTTDTVRPNLRFTLVADFTLGPKMHVYTPEVKGYIPISWTIEDSSNYTAQPPKYPKGQLFMFPEINEVVPVYQNSFRITQDVVMNSANVLQPILNGDHLVRIRGALRYQACDEKVCYIPQNVPLEWTLRVEPLDRDNGAGPNRNKAAPAR